MAASESVRCSYPLPVLPSGVRADSVVCSVSKGDPLTIGLDAPDLVGDEVHFSSIEHTRDTGPPDWRYAPRVDDVLHSMPRDFEVFRYSGDGPECFG